MEQAVGGAVRLKRQPARPGGDRDRWQHRRASPADCSRLRASSSNGAPSRSCSTASAFNRPPWAATSPWSARLPIVDDRIGSPPTPRGRVPRHPRRNSKEHPLRQRPHRHQRFRPHRPAVPEGDPRAPSRELEVVAVNDLTDTQMNAYLFKHDTNYGHYNGEVSRQRDAIVIDGREHQGPSARRTRRSCRGRTSGVDVVIESTGFFTDATKAKAHMRRGRQEGDHLGAGQERGQDHRPRRERGEYDPEKHHIISNASCTTNGLAPGQGAQRQFGIEKGLLTTVHSYTNSQRTLDTRTRSCAARAAPPRTSFRRRPARRRPSRS